LREDSNNYIDDESSRTDEDINNPCQLNKNNNFTKGCKYFKKQYLDRHVNINDHWIVCATRMQSQVNLHSSFAIQAGTDQIKVMRNIRNLYFLIEHNLSTNIFEDLCKLSEIQHHEEQNQFEYSNKTLNIFDNNQLTDNNERAPYGSYQNNVLVREFIESIGRVIEQEIFQELHDTGGWSLMIDESNTISNEKTLAIVSKHSIVLANPIYQFLGLILLPDNTANTIVAEMNQFFQAKNILYDDLMHICMDGTSTMTGIHVGVATQLKKKNPFILEHHYISHKLALAAKDAAKKVEEFKPYEKIVHSIYSYFSRSPEHMMHLRMIEENIGNLHLTVLNIIETHLCENIVAEALYNSINENFIITTKFFADILGTLRINLHKYMNDNDIIAEELPVIVTKFACAAIESLEKRFSNQIQIDAFHIFDPRTLPIENSNFQKYGKDEIETLGNFYSENKNISGNLFLAILNSENLTHEWPLRGDAFFLTFLLLMRFILKQQS
ncbi:679_t:CDS:2, partial [Gigaspora margarita]